MKIGFLLKIAPRNTRKRLTISTQKYYHGAHMEKYVHDLTLKILNHKKEMTKTRIHYFVGSFVVKLIGVEADNHFYKQFTLNYNENNFDEKLNNGKLQ